MVKKLIKDKAVKILEEAEQRLATLAAEAAGSRNYALAEQLLGCARQLAAASQRFCGNAATLKASTSPEGEGAGHDAVSDDDDNPLFERSGMDLVKMGKGKQDGPGYEHKAPKHVVELLLKSVAAKATKRGEFRTSRIFPLVDDDGRKLPAYQGYLVLRWLRHIGLVQRVARQRYQIVSDRDPATSIDTAWQALVERDA